jgi:hypothetical protein
MITLRVNGIDVQTLINQNDLDLAAYLHSIDAEPETEYGVSLLQKAYPEFITLPQARQIQQAWFEPKDETRRN